MIPILRPDETPEQKAAREQKELERRKENEEWKRKQEEDTRLAVPRTIEKLRKEAAKATIDANNLEALFKRYPNLLKYQGRWEKVAYYTKDVNGEVTDYDSRYNCGCCSDSPLEIWPYVNSEFGKIYSNPPIFRVGVRDYGSDSGNTPSINWDEELRKNGIPETIIDRIATSFFQNKDRTAEQEETAEENEDELETETD